MHLRAPSIDHGIGSAFWAIFLGLMIWLFMLGIGISKPTSFLSRRSQPAGSSSTSGCTERTSRGGSAPADAGERPDETPREVPAELGAEALLGRGAREDCAVREQELGAAPVRRFGENAHLALCIALRWGARYP